jgi:Fe2+ or Zn2+ uptake regulation protein
MSNLTALLAEAFRDAALRPTAQRHAVLHFLARRPVHATAEEIFAAVNRADPRASRATVYNNLRSLARAGLVREVASDHHGASRYEACLRPHHHFVCERCGEIEDVPWFELPAEARGRLAGRSIHAYEIVFRGTCAGCGNQDPKGV